MSARRPAHPNAPARAAIASRLIACALVGLSAAAVAAPAAGQRVDPAAQLKSYTTRYYVIHTDLDIDSVREAAVRMTAMAEEYHRRTRGFAGVIRRRMPFYLFKSRADYLAAGGTPGSAGMYVYRGGKGKLMAVADGRPDERLWNTIQHEGFHQFVHKVIRGSVPIWVNEGMAEYFAAGIFTGDGFVVGIVPPHRLRRLQRNIRSGTLLSIAAMMRSTPRQWRRSFSIASYDQAWSMIHFLVHGDGGKYARSLSRFVADVGRRMPYAQAWARSFGRDIKAFEDKWRRYWLAQPPDPSARLYDKAVVAALTSYFARAHSQRQTFETAGAFLDAARAGKLKAHRLDWLPPALLTRALAKAPQVGKWSIQTPERRLPQLVCIDKAGTKFTGSSVIDGGRVKRVSVQVVTKAQAAAAAKTVRPPAGTTRPATRPSPKPTTRPRPAADPVRAALSLARAYRAMGRLDKARAVLAEALKKAPTSPHAPAARKLLDEL